MHAGRSLCKPGGTKKAKVQKETTTDAVASAILHTNRFARFSYCTRGVTRVISYTCSICDKCYNVVRVLTCAVMTYALNCAAWLRTASLPCSHTWLPDCNTGILWILYGCLYLRKANCIPTRISRSEPAVPRFVCVRACDCVM